MVYSKKWVTNQDNVTAVLKAYRSKELKSVRQIAEELNTRTGNIWWITKKHLSREEHTALKTIRYSLSKLGDKNPMKGKFKHEHPNWKGICEDGYGYQTIKVGEKRIFVHQQVLMKALGLQKIPMGWEVHHIDGNTRNNNLDNLALATKLGHATIHSRELDSASLRLKKLRLAEAIKYLT